MRGDCCGQDEAGIIRVAIRVPEYNPRTVNNETPPRSEVYRSQLPLFGQRRLKGASFRSAILDTPKAKTAPSFMPLHEIVRPSYF